MTAKKATIVAVISRSLKNLIQHKQLFLLNGWLVLA